MGKYYILLVFAFFIVALNTQCSKKTIAQKKNKELRKSLKAKSPEERRILRFERRLKLSPKDLESVNNVKNGYPNNEHDRKVYSKHFKKKRRIEKKLSKITRKKQQRIQTQKTKRRMDENLKKAESVNRYKRNKKINK